MIPLVYSTNSLHDLEQFIVAGLCAHENLDQAQVKVQRSLLRKGDAKIGLFIRISGPRLMQSQAIWIEPESRLLFYNSAGKRFATVKLAEAPELPTVSI
ncbi:MAG TPA: hypothetical protein PKA06_09955 [Gemmatales bacterium]|nr:hypothetical protein [Gemmatales bacterium]